tara:strand:+ start:277 stop:1212 length:936 start_codon:yes stop_codon:yes gene_type:complete
MKNLKTKFDNNIDTTEELLIRNNGVPEDYHCDCYLDNYLGEIYNTKLDKYYSQRARNNYYNPKAGTHIAPGHFLGYRWAIQNFTDKGDWVFDPTVGTGTAIVESINNGRNGAGIELEFPDITKANIDYQFERDHDLPSGKYFFTQGNAKNVSSILRKGNFKDESIQLIINGTPYPTLGSVSSDAPERKNFKSDGSIGMNKTFDYSIEDNFGKKKGQEYWDLIREMYLGCIPFMKVGGKMVILIKDMIRNKEPYLLHKMIIDEILDSTDKLKYYGTYLHKHIPATLFMSTYSKRFPEVKIPIYQTGIVLEKI